LHVWVNFVNDPFLVAFLSVPDDVPRFTFLIETTFRIVELAGFEPFVVAVYLKVVEFFSIHVSRG
jgi:hypothetical protein